MDKLKKREYSLDFVKVLATIVIVFHHYQLVTGVHYESGINFFDGIFYFGWTVELFFILSGYFMYSYIQKIEDGITFPEFYFKRYFRLFPVMALGAITYEIFSIIYHNLYQSLWFDIPTTFWGTIIASLGIQTGWALPNPNINNPTWYISVLMLCYIVFYFIVYISKRVKIHPQYLFAFMIFLGMGIGTFGINLPFLNGDSARGYYAFFFGVLLAGILKQRKIKIKEALICSGILIVIPLFIHFRNAFMDTGINYILTFVFYPSLIIVCKSPVVSKWLDRKWIGLLGRISFDVYIWHWPFFILLDILMKSFHWNLALGNPWTMIGYTIFCYIFGTFSYFCIEMPINRYINKKVSQYRSALC